MDLKRRLSLVVVILSVAFGAGHLVQNAAGKPVRSAQTQNLEPVGITLVAAGPEALLPDPEKIASVVQLPAPSFASVPTEEMPSIFTLPPDAVQQVGFGTLTSGTDATANDCPASLDLQIEPSAMIGLTLMAPCHTDERVVLNHAGLAITAKTSATGALYVSIPALTSEAEVTVRFADGQAINGQLAVPEAANQRRFGVQWIGDDSFQLNAFENGAGYGERGHVSDVYTQTAQQGQPQNGGFLSVLGDSRVDLPMLAEVYTYPASADTPVRIVVEAAITESTCNREILGETLAEAGSSVVVTDLSLMMPECSSIGDILVLKNLDPDLKIAAAN